MKVDAGETATMSIAQDDSSSFSAWLDLILSCLPLNAEEGTLRDSLAEDDLLVALSNSGIGSEASSLLVTMLRRQFEALALLDRAELAQGRWAFVSFPASLLGRSIVEILSAPEQAILSSDYWEQGDHRPAAVKNEQRALLHRIESERLRQNPAARPVRVVHVAWAVIRMGERFLLHRREDQDRPGEKTHVLPGGRFNPGDLSAEKLDAQSGVLREIFDVASPRVNAALDKTLIRELFEELGLHHEEDYHYARWHRLEPYRKVAGAGNRHAYTEYGFQLYTLKLTAAGEVRLLDRAAESKTLTWFSAAELAAPQRADGASAFVDVLHEAWGNAVAVQLLSVPDSAASDFMLREETQMMDLPHAPDAPLLQGKTGKAKPLLLALDEIEWHLLLLLGWHARGFTVRADASVRLLGGGWVRVADEIAATVGHSLLKKLQRQSLPLVEMRGNRYLRLSIAPEILMFGTEMFSYAIDGSAKEGGTFSVERTSVATPWGELVGGKSEHPIKRNTWLILKALEGGNHPDGIPGVNASSWEKNLRQQLLPELRLLGLRHLWTTENKDVSLVSGIRPLR